jgi:hypothetical protein
MKCDAFSRNSSAALCRAANQGIPRFLGSASLLFVGFWMAMPSDLNAQTPALVTTLASTNGLRLIWSAADPNFLVETTTNLLPPVTWETVPVVPDLVGDNFVTLSPLSEQEQFFRLRYAPASAPQTIAPSLPANSVPDFNDSTSFLSQSTSWQPFGGTIINLSSHKPLGSTPRLASHFSGWGIRDLRARDLCAGAPHLRPP